MNYNKYLTKEEFEELVSSVKSGEAEGEEYLSEERQVFVEYDIYELLGEKYDGKGISEKEFDELLRICKNAELISAEKEEENFKVRVKYDLFSLLKAENRIEDERLKSIFEMFDEADMDENEREKIKSAIMSKEMDELFDELEKARQFEFNVKKLFLIIIECLEKGFVEEVKLTLREFIKIF